MLRRVTLAALLIGSLTSAPAHAAACCLSSSAFGIGRLSSWETFALIAGGVTSPVAGRWDGERLWRPNAPGYSENEWRGQLSGLVAVHQRVQLSGRVPYVLTTKASGTDHEAAGGLGDSQVSVRYEPVFQGEYSFLPEIALTAGLTAPIGRTSINSQTNLGSDVTSRGAWVPSASASFELARDNWFAQVGGGVTVPLPMEGPEPGTRQQFGLGWQASLAGGYEVRKGLVLSLVGRAAYEGPLSLDGRVVPQSAAFDFGGGPAISYKLVSHWTLQGGLDAGLFMSGVGENRQGRITGNLAVRYAYF